MKSTRQTKEGRLPLMQPTFSDPLARTIWDRSIKVIRDPRCQTLGDARKTEEDKPYARSNQKRQDRTPDRSLLFWESPLARDFAKWALTSWACSKRLIFSANGSARNLSCSRLRFPSKDTSTHASSGAWRGEHLALLGIVLFGMGASPMDPPQFRDVDQILWPSGLVFEPDQSP